MEIINLVDKLPRHPTKQYAKRELSELKYLVIHHSGTASGDPYSFATYHVGNRNWPGIGYDYVISKKGTIYKVNNLTTVNYHVGNANRESVGVCLVGDFTTEKPTQEQYNSVAELAKVLTQEYKLEIKGHKDLMDTTCPGNFDFAYLNTLLRHTVSEFDSFLSELENLIKKWRV